MSWLPTPARCTPCPSIVVMRESVPSQRLTPKLARDIVMSIAADADSLEFEMTGADRI